MSEISMENRAHRAYIASLNADLAEARASEQQLQEELDGLSPEDPGYEAAADALDAAQTAVGELLARFPSWPRNQAGA
jgi:Lon protease-like protein